MEKYTEQVTTCYVLRIFVHVKMIHKLSQDWMRAGKLLHVKLHEFLKFFIRSGFRKSITQPKKCKHCTRKLVVLKCIGSET